ncbi:MAG: tRNA 2-thiouridine(34) synthase MnmA [Candidatus Paceibacterota bacterium]|jgi:tRNA-specific 2-thiouridylase
MLKISKEKKVFVGLSGGVDSSVAALMLKNKGFDVTGVFMRCYNIDGCAERDAEDARRVAEHLKIPFYVWDFEAEYKKRVVDYMIEGYRKGITPNPDIECNREIKFGLFLKRALKFGADFVATGHYVRLVYSRGTAVVSAPATETPLPLATATPVETGDRARRRSESFRLNKSIFNLFEGRDGNKDQSYFLWTLTQKQLEYCLFPIGDYLKPVVRVMAKRAGLPTADKKDSQGICFLGKVTISDFLKDYLPEKEGLVLNEDGEKIGEHNGAHFYTIGQRQGIGNIKHQRGNKIHKPVYVISKNIKKNMVVVAEEGNDLLRVKEVTLTGVNFINKDSELKIKDGNEMSVLVRVRYRQPLFGACIKYQISSVKKNSNKKNFKLVFDKPQKFVAVGQSAVFYEYQGNSSLFSTRSGRRSLDKSELRMLGGGIITGV